MKSLVKLKAEPGIWLTDMPMPTYGDNDVLIKIKKTAICGTDIHIYQWDAWAQKEVSVPLIIGHEFMGEIVAMGANVQGFTIGERVSGEGHITCGQCRYCQTGIRHLCPKTIGTGWQRTGCFAEYFVLPANNVFSLPKDISDDVAACFDPFGNATHTALSFELVAKDVLITGAGPIGIMAAAIAKYAGARHVVITDVNEYRLDLARKVAHVHAINPQQQSIATIMQQLGMIEGFEIGLEMSGHPRALNDLLNAMNSGGQVALLGILPENTVIDFQTVIFKELHIKGIYGREIFGTWYQMVAMLQSGLDISPVITHHFAVDEFQKAFDVMASGHSGKVILEWDKTYAKPRSLC